ncbi:MAG: tetratricopeptide repeat protein [Aestuariivita sp.]|jgi:tetratricopeptide (TPR) repeat protein|nr:tetratricopeptide repeat protein [Aestuariivita sp.]
MSIRHTNLKGTVAAGLLIVMFSLPLAAQTAEEQGLLADLAQADPDAAIRIDRELQAIWSKSGSSSMDLLLRRGREAMEAGETRVAIEHLTALTDHAPDFAEGWHLRAQAYYGADLYGPAVADLERALALNPHNYDAIFGLGAVLESFGDHAGAFEAYSRVKAMHPHHEDVDSALARLESRVSGTSL